MTMEVVRHPRAMQALSRRWHGDGRLIAFVPTMGFLHEGHISLIRVAREHGDRIVVSIFVNPTQFGPREDLTTYPRDLPRDLALCREAGVDAVFLPESSDMYASDASVVVDESTLSLGLCGAFRPGHFRGVLTVVAKLFNIVLPDVAVFGQKDVQQACLVRRMVRDLNFPITVVVAPTVREPDGLALSSRNVYLSGSDRREAVALIHALEAARALVERDGERRWAVVEEAIRDRLKREAPSAIVDYVAGVDQETLQPVVTVDGPIRMALAVRLGRTRLIDNLAAVPPDV